LQIERAKGGRGENEERRRGRINVEIQKGT
jgi:hypothetical protein